MDTIGRNEPCLCGSGKKYKKCCRVKESDAFKQVVLEREAVDVQSEILRFAFAQPAFIKSVQQSFRTYNIAEDMRDSFYFFVGIWSLFTKGIVDRKTALELFVSHTNGTRIRPDLKGIIQSWVGVAPSIVRVTSVSEKNLTVRDIFSQDLKDVKIIDKVTEVPTKGSLLAGYIVPFVNNVSTFFTSALSFEGEMAEKTEQLVLQKYAMYGEDVKHSKQESSLFLQENFLELLELFMSEEDPDVVMEDLLNLEWNNDQEAEVAAMLGERLQKEETELAVVEAGYMLWRSYCIKKQPAIKNGKIYAAALHYLVQDKIPMDDKLTQKEAAELYDASPASVGNRLREMAVVLESELQQLTMGIHN